MSAPRWAVGMQKLGPGVYADGRGALHVKLSEICHHLGVPCTPRNQEIAQRAAEEAIRKTFGAMPSTTIVEERDADPR
jgi:hypothetical protein